MSIAEMATVRAFAKSVDSAVGRPIILMEVPHRINGRSENEYSRIYCRTGAFQNPRPTRNDYHSSNLVRAEANILSQLRIVATGNGHNRVCVHRSVIWLTTHINKALIQDR